LLLVSGFAHVAEFMIMCYFELLIKPSVTIFILLYRINRSSVCSCGTQ